MSNSSNPKKVHICSNCGAQFTHGGRAGKGGKPPLCPRDYHRARRGATAAELLAPPKGEGERKAVAFRPSDAVLKALKTLHKKEVRERPKLSLGALIERAVVAYLESLGIVV